MMEPAFDYDDLINQDMEESSEPPPEEMDEAFLDEMISKHGDAPNDNAGAGENSHNDNHDVAVDEDTDDLVGQTEETASVREAFTRRTEREDLFSFERYKANSNWRSEKVGSPTNSTMRAKEWKSFKEAYSWEDGSTTEHMLFSTYSTKRQTPSAPDSQLLEYMAQRSRRPTQLLPTRPMPTRPLPGEQCMPMTFGNGNRVFVRIRNEAETISSENHEKRHYALGTSMSVLLERVKSIRRQQEHSKQQRITRELGVQTTQDEEMGEDVEEIRSHDHQLWVDKHAPSSFAHLLSDERTNREVLRALRAWDPYVFHKEPPPRPDFGQQINDNFKEKDKKPSNANTKDRRPEESSRVILLSGPPGVGKTTLAHIVARHAGYRPLEVNGSDERSASVLTERVIRAMESSTLNVAMMQGKGNDAKSRPNCLILDEIDGADAKNAIQSLVDIIRAEIPSKSTKAKAKAPYLRRPIIFICNNKFAPALKPLLPFAKQFNVNPPSSSRLVARLRSVLSAEKMSVFGGSSLLHQLVATASGDIRSCLYTLQFASARAKEIAANTNRNDNTGESLVDISSTLSSALNGDGLKDERKDIVGTVTAIFRKEKAKKTSGVRGVLDSVQSYGDNSRILDCIFTNILNVSYIDPTLDRCAAAHEWLSSSDIYRSRNTTVSSTNSTAQHAMEALHIPSASAAIHLLCRVEQRPDLTYSTRDLSDARFQREANYALAQKFVEGLSPHARGAKCVNVLATETIPYALWILSSGEGSSSLNRAVTSFEILNKQEAVSFNVHVATLRSLGLTYRVDEGSAFERSAVNAAKIVLEPPIDRLIKFVDLDLSTKQMRQEIPPAMKELLAQRAAHERIRVRGHDSMAPTGQSRTEVKPSRAAETLPSPMEVEKTGKESPKTANKRVEREKSGIVPPPAKRSKGSVTAKNFLSIQAKKAKEARSARTAARVGVERSKNNKFSHTGSQVPFRQVVRLKYVKGFTQAVRTPCRLEDLV